MTEDRCPCCNQELPEKEGGASPGIAPRSTKVTHTGFNLPAFSPHPEILELSIDYGWQSGFAGPDPTGRWSGSILATAMIPGLKRGKITGFTVTSGDSRWDGRITIDAAAPENGPVRPKPPWRYHFTGIGKPTVTPLPPQKATAGHRTHKRPVEGS